VLRPVFAALRALGTPLTHYKVCSTFDSSPEIGSIGQAIEIGQDVFGNAGWVPLVVGAPPLGRFCVFGNLFARMRADDPHAVFRLDRHPTMSRHPVTPMDEADLRAHLRKQTDQPIGLMNVLDLAGADDEVNARLRRAAAENPIVLFDALTNDHLATVGRLLWETATGAAAPFFCAGSSAVEYALAAHFQALGAAGTPPVFAAEPVEQIVAVSGSCSPVTERQIAWADENGFALVALDPARPNEAAAVEAAARALLDEKRPGVVIYTSRGGVDANALAGALVGAALGRILRDTLARTGVRRVAVCGGDTSGHVAQTLTVDALTMRAPMAPGSPLCRAWARNDLADGLEIVFKGGQVGTDDFFGRVRDGIVPRD